MKEKLAEKQAGNLYSGKISNKALLWFYYNQFMMISRNVHRLPISLWQQKHVSVYMRWEKEEYYFNDPVQVVIRISALKLVARSLSNSVSSNRAGVWRKKRRISRAIVRCNICDEFSIKTQGVLLECTLTSAYREFIYSSSMKANMVPAE